MFQTTNQEISRDHSDDLWWLAKKNIGLQWYWSRREQWSPVNLDVMRHDATWCDIQLILRRKPPADCRSSDSNSPIFHPAPCTRPHPPVMATWPQHGHSMATGKSQPQTGCLDQAIAAGLAKTGRNALLQTWQGADCHGLIAIIWGFP